MPQFIKTYMDKIQIGAEQSYKNFAVFPVLSDYVIPFDYLTLDEALKEDMIEVVEINKGVSGPKLSIFVIIFKRESLMDKKKTHNSVD